MSETLKPNRQWQLIWTRKFPPFLGSCFMNIFMQRPGFDFCRHKLFLPQGDLHAYYFDREEFARLTTAYLQSVRDQDIATYAAAYEDKFRQLLAWAQTVAEQPLAQATDAVMSALMEGVYQRVGDSGDDQMIAFVALESVGRELEETIAALPDAEHIRQWVATPPRETVIAKARLELLKMVRDSLASPAALQAYARKYSWINIYDFADEPWTVADIERQVAQVEDAAGEIKRCEQARGENMDSYERWLAAVDDPVMRWQAAFVHEFAYLKEMRDDYRRKAYYLLIPFWEEVGRRLGMSRLEANHLLINEIIGGLRGGMSLADLRQRARERQAVFSLVVADGELRIAAQDLTAAYLGEEVSGETATVSGTVAHRGVVTGTVRIIMHQAEFSKLQPGDILVTAMTHPEFLPVMKRAGAIVTDEGGLTCHAAITAREMDKPCVIGTKHATKVFKDGDLVEVDAVKGIVKKIKK